MGQLKWLLKLGKKQRMLLWVLRRLARPKLHLVGVTMGMGLLLMPAGTEAANRYWVGSAGGNTSPRTF